MGNALNGRNYGEMPDGKLALPSAPDDIRGRPRCVWAEDGRWAIIRKKRENPQMAGTRAEWPNYCPHSASVDIRDVCGRQMEDGKLWGKTDKNGLNGRNQGGVG